MKILFYRYGSICEPDIIEAMKHLGHEVFCINLEITDKNIPTQTVIKHVSDTLLSSSFDCIFSINFYPVLSEICNIMKIPYICWTVDSPVMELYSDSYSNEWNRIFLFDSMQYQDFAPYNPMVSCTVSITLLCSSSVNPGYNGKLMICEYTSSAFLQCTFSYP